MADKIIDKTNEIINLHNEMNDLIYEIKEELMVLKKSNELLQEENAELKKMLLKEDKQESLKVEELITIVEEVETKVVAQDITIEDAKEVEDISEIPVVNETIKVKVRKPKSNGGLYEFFLGKNIIAKIASVLIFLGFVSFGQIAYINWLSDIGRVILILFVGITFFLGGYFFDKKGNTVFNNAFYVIGLLITFLSITLAFNTYELIGFITALYLSILLVGLTFVYFYKKRYDFLDTFLVIFYIFIVGYLVVFGNEYRITNFGVHLGMLIAMIGLGYIMYVYILRFKEVKDKLSVIGIIYFAVQFLIIMALLTFSGYTSFNIPIIFELIVLMIFLMYLANFKFLEKSIGYRIVTIIASLLILFTVAYSFSAVLDYYNLLNDYIHIYLFAIIILAPMYGYLFFKDDTDPKVVSRIDPYLIVLGIIVLIYVLQFETFHHQYNELVPFYVHNLVLGISVLLIYLAYRFTNKFTFRIMFIIYFLYLAAGAITRFTNVNIPIVIRRSSVFFEIVGLNDPAEYLIYIFSLIIGIALLVSNKMMKKIDRKEEYVESLVFYGFNLMISIPIVFLIVDNFHITIERRYFVLMLSIITLFIIGYRYLLNLKIFNVKNLKEFKLGVQMLSVILIIIISFIYFDHNFTLGIDLFTFLFVLLLNAYLVFPLKELYDYAKEKYDLETVFIIIYMTGVVIQSVFITFYINFTYDKVFLSSYFMIASALAILYGFRYNLLVVRKLGLGAIYFALIKFFTYDFFSAEFTLTVRMVTYFILGLLLMTIAFMYGYLEKKYGEEVEE